MVVCSLAQHEVQVDTDMSAIPNVTSHALLVSPGTLLWDADSAPEDASHTATCGAPC